jgi:hypothetical protein
MGCDFYVYTYLEIKHTHGLAYIELDKQKGYFCDCIEPMMDSDDDDVEAFNEKCKKYCELFLQPILRPILIYDNKQFMKQSYKEKYQDVIVNHVYAANYWRDTAPLRNIEDIISIHKKEIREERS